MAKGKSTAGPAKKPLQSQRPGKALPDNAGAKLSPEEVYRLIQESAYFKAKERGFAPGHEVQDWIEAEAEVRQRLDSRT